MEIEKAFLANLITGGLKEAKKIKEIIHPNDFIVEMHQEIYQAIVEFVENDKPFDAPLLIDHLRVHSRLANATTPVRYSKVILDILDWKVSSALQGEYIEKFYEQRLRRKISAIIEELPENFDKVDPADFFKKIDNIKKEVKGISEFVKLSDIMSRVLDSIEKKQGVDFQFSLMDLNNSLGGLARGELLLIGGFTSQGKSSLCIQMAMDFAEQGKKVLFCSSEMSEFETARRVLGNYCDLVISDLRRGILERDISELRDVIDTLKSWKVVLHIISSTEQVGKAVLKYQPDIVIVDHLHNLRGQGRSPYERTTYNIKSLHEICRVERVGMVVASQLHRPQDEKLRPPRISDLRESGAVEETANSIILLYWKNQRENGEIKEQEIMEVRLVKNRDGKTGKFPMLFEPRYCRFRNIFKGDIPNGK